MESQQESFPHPASTSHVDNQESTLVQVAQCFMKLFQRLGRVGQSPLRSRGTIERHRFVANAVQSDNVLQSVGRHV